MNEGRNLSKRRTGLALSALTALVLVLGYSVVQLLEGDWQPSRLEISSSPSAPNSRPKDQPPIIVLRPNAPDSAAPTEWEHPTDEPLDTVGRDRVLR
jgi:hypothetical protein